MKKLLIITLCFFFAIFQNLSFSYDISEPLEEESSKDTILKMGQIITSGAYGTRIDHLKKSNSKTTQNTEDNSSKTTVLEATQVMLYKK